VFIKLDPLRVVDEIVFIVICLTEKILDLSVRKISVLHYLLKLFECVSPVPTLVWQHVCKRNLIFNIAFVRKSVSLLCFFNVQFLLKFFRMNDCI